VSWRIEIGGLLIELISHCELFIDDLVKRTDLEEETIKELMKILKAEFE
jgi:hypothetical protein